MSASGVHEPAVYARSQGILRNFEELLNFQNIEMQSRLKITVQSIVFRCFHVLVMSVDVCVRPNAHIQTFRFQ